MKDEATTITGITEKREGDEDIVTVSARYRLAGPARVNEAPESVGTFTFSKSKGWALRESMRGGGQRPEISVSSVVEYDGSVGGIPLLKKVEFWRDEPASRVKIVDCNISEIKPGAVPEREFKLAAFGIRDIGEEQETNYWLYLIVAGVALIAAAVIVACVSARRLRA